MKLLLIAFLLSAFCLAQTAPQHAHDVQMRGAKGMGFSQTATTHHFLLAKDGGVIQVEANDPKDAQSRDQVRMHLEHIARAFAAGDFNIPMFVHDRNVPGTATMARLKSDITYKYEKTTKGGRVNISTGNPEALAAVHDFLVFQIKDHGTGDPLQTKQ